ncbi:hypothetical protein ACIBCO_24585 [Streptomyces violascens]|uniref:hypothetical protein n=1 Tax=Streptomyces violascens TaxID=67381 RepID=UPI0037AF15E5
MSNHSESARGSQGPRDAVITRAESRHLAVASASLGPWGAAAAVGAVGGLMSLAIGSVAEGFGAVAAAGAGSVALMLFFLVGGAGAALGGGRTERADHRIRRWARAHPWRVASVPAALMLLSDVFVRQVVTSETLFASVGDGVWRGVVVAGVVGLVGKVGRGWRR